MPTSSWEYLLFQVLNIDWVARTIHNTFQGRYMELSMLGTSEKVSPPEVNQNQNPITTVPHSYV